MEGVVIVLLAAAGIIVLYVAAMFQKACKRLDQIEEHLRPAKRFERMK